MAARNYVEVSQPFHINGRVPGDVAAMLGDGLRLATLHGFTVVTGLLVYPGNQAWDSNFLLLLEEVDDVRRVGRLFHPFGDAAFCALSYTDQKALFPAWTDAGVAWDPPLDQWRDTNESWAYIEPHRRELRARMMLADGQDAPTWGWLDVFMTFVSVSTRI